MTRHATLDRYVILQFIPIAIASILFFSLTVVLIDLLMNLWKFMQEGSSAKDVATVCALYVPKAVWYAVPLSCLFASSLTLSALYSQNEMTVLFASGLPLYRICAPMIVFCAVCAPLLFVFDDAVVTPAYARKTDKQRALLNEERTLDSDKPVVLCDGGKIIYRAEYYLDSSRFLLQPLFIFRDDDGKCQAIIQATDALWDEASLCWRVNGAVQYTYNEDGFVSAKNGADEEYLTRLDEEPKTFRSSDVAVEEVNAATARQYIDHLKKSGLPYSESLSLYYKKYSFPCVLFIVALLSAGLSGRTRKNVTIASLALSVSFAVMFYVFQMITMLLSKFGILPPLYGAWLPVVTFTGLAAWTVATSRT